MIASTPVARWTWGRDHRPGEEVVACLGELLTAQAALRKHGFVVGASGARVSVSEAGTPNSLLFEGELTPGAALPPAYAARLLAERVDAGRRPGEIGSVDALAVCSGSVVDDADGRETRQDMLFLLGASAFADFVGIELLTYTDVWLPYDLKGRPQPQVFEVNGPRLSAVLNELSKGLESETDPDDPTCFAKPTPTGAENHFDADGVASDVWGSFEVLTRYDVFRHAPGFGRVGYQRSAEGEVQYVSVGSRRGEVLGYLWASDSERAASFEPRDAGDDVTYRAGLVWLERLRAAHDRGLSPSAALAELSALPYDDPAGQVAPGSEPRTDVLTALRERAGDR